jgi:uncharacterized membrane protein YfcA
VIEWLLAGLAAVVAGAVNAVAGGGTLITFPTLTALGVPTVSANVTNTVALCPGYFGGAYAQRADLVGQRGRMRRLLGVAALGGLAGSVLLVISSESLFRALVPYLILGATALLALQDRLRVWLRIGVPSAPAVEGVDAAEGVDGVEAGPPIAPVRRDPPWLPVPVFVVAVYGGYFGAGLGIMLLAILGLVIHESLNRLNALKQVLSLVINVVAAVFFVFSGKVYWGFALAMAVGSLVGGNLGGRVAHRLDPKALRVVVVIFGTVVGIVYLVR